MDRYKTVLAHASDEYTVKRSRFIGYCSPVKTQSEAEEFINSIKSKHWDARHNVYAYCLREGMTRRYSDDGEPQGTAGIPTLDVLLKQEITDCCIVVTRYFGGILLGGGGLVRAYSHTAGLAVAAAGIINMALCSVMRIKCDYNFYGKLPGVIANAGGVITDSVFEQEVTLELKIPTELSKGLCEIITDISGARLSAELIREEYSAVDGV